MTIASSINRNDYVGANNLATYSYNFKINSNADLLVTKRDLAGVETTLLLNTDYSVTGAGLASGGTITLTAGNLPTGYSLTIRRVVSITQNTDIRNQGVFFASVHEDEFDKLTMIDQQQQDLISRSVKLHETVSSAAVDPTLPLPAANQAIVWNSDGTKLVNAAISTAVINTAASENVSYVAQGTGAVTRNVRSRLREIFDAKDYGALGDGVTNDTSALQAAINAVEANGIGDLYIPPGTYLHTGLTFAKAPIIRGSGWNTILMNTSAVNHSLSNSVTGATTLGAVFEDFVLDHNGGGSAVDGIHIDGASNHLNFRHLYVRNAPRDGIYLNGQNSSNKNTLYPVLTSCLVENPGRNGLWVNGTANTGVITGGRYDGGSTGYNIRFEDTYTGTTGSFPNTWTVCGCDTPGGSPLAGIYDDGNSNRYFGPRFESNTVDMIFGVHAGNSMVFGFTKQTGPGPVIQNHGAARPIFFDKQNFIRSFETSGFLEYWDEAAGAERKIGGLLYQPPGATVGTVTTTETTLWTYTLPANVLLVAGSSVELELSGLFSNTANNKLLKLYFGSHSLALHNATSQNVNWRFRGRYLAVTGGATGSFRFEGVLHYGTSILLVDEIVTSQDFTATNIIKLTGTATATNDILSKTVTLKSQPGTAL